ncbi:rhombosortase [Ferrimonas balearica]|uniref:rhombosortase n=1 Tax=Ferrimonas balearica TaxID=44012 RepID=UPI001C9961A1|nr:rhombosortase [Ferrimonas balearica]MBY5991909.1 rhombosortase [Ferrimonas balearica]
MASTKAFGLPKPQQWAWPALLSALALALWALPGLYETLIWSRPHLDQGQWWRLLSGHLLHSNTAHLLMNLGGLWLIFALHQPHYRFAPMALVSLAMMAMIGLGLYWWVPETVRYVGLSALLHGLFTWGALADIRRGWRSGYALLVGVLAKVGWELSQGGSADVAALIDARVAVESHALGVASALLCFALVRLYQRSW